MACSSMHINQHFGGTIHKEAFVTAQIITIKFYIYFNQT
jgi:hypothetical protein